MKYIIIAGVLIILVFLGVLHYIPIGIEPLTELYIENHTDLPQNVFLNKSHNFSFTTHNLEYQVVDYEYTINAYDVNGTLISNIGYGEFALGNNYSQTINSEYVFNKPFDRAEIEVKIYKNLIGTPEFKRKLWWPDPNYPMEIEVHFWVDEIVQTRITITED